MDRLGLSYEVLLEITNVLNSQRDTDSLWRAITEQIKQIIPWDRAGIMLYHPEIGGFKFYALETSTVTRVLQRDSIIPREGSAAGWVFDHHRIHVRPNLHEQQVFMEDEYYLQEGLGRMINLPLMAHDACLGTLNIGSVQTGELEPDDLRFLQQVATQIALAIDNVRAYEQIDRLREQLVRENEYLIEEVKGAHKFGPIVGSSAVFRRALTLAETVAPTDATV
ncbi:MAG TPA: GAF domain-containing protein, partial [Nitrospiraceae bacterium]|nr:GAF domain-containing protein [Nitrospiraceae bacterium]